MLKKTKFSNTYKCGFPNQSLDDYLRVFKNHKLEIEIINEYRDDNDKIESMIKNIDINDL